MDSKDIDRRTLLIQSATGLGAAWVIGNWAAIAEAQQAVRLATAADQPFPLGCFTHEQAVEVEAVAAQIIPTDETPGAREAGVVYFIDRALVTFERDQQATYFTGLQELRTRTKELVPSAEKFSSLTSPQQIQVLTAMEGTPFFDLVRNHTIAGFFADPVHGGNLNKIGWKLIEFDDSLRHEPPFGYYDSRAQSDD